MSRPRDPRLPTRRVVGALLAQLRTLAANDDVLVRRLREVLVGGKERLADWLSVHQTDVPQDELVPTSFRSWFSENRRVPPPVPPEWPAWRRADVLERLRHLLDGDPTDDELRTLLAAGLSLVFMRRNEGAQDSYYHHLMADLMSEGRRREIEESLRVPPGRGTVGWIAKRARMHAMRYGGSLRSRPQAVALPTCFSDPRGRVAGEDLLCGNRSFVAVPVFSRDGNDHEALGIVFAFFPVDGLFLLGSSTPSPFVTWFGKAVNDVRDALLGALQTEGWAAGASAPSSARPGGEVPDEMTAVLDLVMPPNPPPDDPIGALVALVARDRGRDGVEVKARVREQAVVERLLTEHHRETVYDGWTSPSLAALPTALTRPDHPRIWEATEISGVRTEEVLLLLATPTRAKAILSLHCRGGMAALARTPLLAILDEAARDGGDLARIAAVLDEFDEVEEETRSETGRLTEPARAIDDLRHLLCEEILDALALALRGEADPGARRSTYLATQLLVSGERLSAQVERARDAVGSLARKIRDSEPGEAQDPLPSLEISLLSFWLVGERWRVEEGSPEDLEHLRQVVERTDEGFLQVLSFLLEHAPNLGPRATSQKSWLFDQSDFQVTFVSESDDLVNVGGTPVVLPPVFFPAARGGYATEVAVRINQLDGSELRCVHLYRGGGEGQPMRPFSTTTWRRHTDAMIPLAFRALEGRLSPTLAPAGERVSWAQLRARFDPSFRGEALPPPEGSLLHDLDHLLPMLTRTGDRPEASFVALGEEAGETQAMLVVYRASGGAAVDGPSPEEPGAETWRTILEGAGVVYRSAYDTLLRYRHARESVRMSEMAHIRHLLRHETDHLLAVHEDRRWGRHTPEQARHAEMAARSLVVVVELVINEELPDAESLPLCPRSVGSLLAFVKEARCLTRHWDKVAVDVGPGSDVDVVGDTFAAHSVYFPDLRKRVPRRAWLFLLLANLFDNAFERAMEVGGTVRLSSRARPDGWIAVEVENDGPVWADAGRMAEWVRLSQRPDALTRGRHDRAEGRDTIRDAHRALELRDFEIRSPRPGDDQGTLVQFCFRPRGGPG